MTTSVFQCQALEQKGQTQRAQWSAQKPKKRKVTKKKRKTQKSPKTQKNRTRELIRPNSWFLKKNGAGTPKMPGSCPRGPRRSPEIPQRSPEVPWAWRFPGGPRKFPGGLRRSPEVPRSFPGLPAHFEGPPEIFRNQTWQTKTHLRESVFWFPCAKSTMTLTRCQTRECLRLSSATPQIVWVRKSASLHPKRPLNMIQKNKKQPKPYDEAISCPMRVLLTQNPVRGRGGTPWRGGGLTVLAVSTVLRFLPTPNDSRQRP